MPPGNGAYEESGTGEGTMNSRVLIKVMAVWVGLVAVSSIAVMWGAAAILPKFQPRDMEAISQADVTRAAIAFGSLLALFVVFALIPDSGNRPCVSWGCVAFSRCQSPPCSASSGPPGRKA